MSCLTYTHNDPFDSGTKYISGTTCNGTTDVYNLSFGDSVCMEAELPLIVCDGLTISGSCDSPVVTPTPSPTITQTSTPSPTPTSFPFGTYYLADVLDCDCNTLETDVIIISTVSLGSIPRYFGESNYPATKFYVKSITTPQSFDYDFRPAGTLQNDVICANLSVPSCSTVTPTPTATPTPTVTSTPGASPTPTTTLTATPTQTQSPQIYTHGTVRGTCSDFCTTNYQINNLTNATNNYAALTIGDTIFGQGGVAGFVAYSNISTDTTTGPFRIAEINTSGVIQGIYVCVGGVCDPL